MFLFFLVLSKSDADVQYSDNAVTVSGTGRIMLEQKDVETVHLKGPGPYSLGNMGFGALHPKNLVIYEELTVINRYLFYGCDTLIKMTFDGTSKLETIESTAFRQCTSLTEITFPDSLKQIQENAFYGCTKLTTIHFPSGLTLLGNSAFANCASISEITIPDSLPSIGDSAFMQCWAVTSLTLGSGVTSIGLNAFWNCTNLATVNFGENSALKTIGQSAFKETGIVSIEIPDSVTTFSGSCFHSCKKLTTVKLPKGLTSTGSSLFTNCIELKSITLPDTLTTLGANCFSGTGFESFEIPAHITMVGISCFMNCPNLATVKFLGESTNYQNSVFTNCVKLTSVTLPAQAKILNDNTFDGCTSLVEVNLPAGITQIGGSAFYNCAKLTTVNFHSNIQIIWATAFYGCTSLKSVEFPEDSKLFKIALRAFKLCTNLEVVKLPKSLTTIENDAFTNITNLNFSIYSDNIKFGDKMFLYTNIDTFEFCGVNVSGSENFLAQALSVKNVFIGGSYASSTIGGKEVTGTSSCGKPEPVTPHPTLKPATPTPEPPTRSPYPATPTPEPQTKELTPGRHLILATEEGYTYNVAKGYSVAINPDNNDNVKISAQIGDNSTDLFSNDVYAVLFKDKGTLKISGKNTIKVYVFNQADIPSGDDEVFMIGSGELSIGNSKSETAKYKMEKGQKLRIFVAQFSDKSSYNVEAKNANIKKYTIDGKVINNIRKINDETSEPFVIYVENENDDIEVNVKATSEEPERSFIINNKIGDYQASALSGPGNNGNNGKDGKTLIIILVVVFAVLIIVCVVLFFVLRNRKQDAPQSEIVQSQTMI